MNYSGGDPRDEVFEGRALVAAFLNRETAHEAARRLRDEGFGKPWIGVTAPGESSRAEGAGATSGTRVSPDADSLGEKIERFFSGESGNRTLYDELIRHGVAESEARRVDASLRPNSAILAVDGHNHPELAAHVIEQAGGQILAGESFAGMAAGEMDAGTQEGTLRGSAVLGYGDPSTAARGETIDEQRRMQLREERLSVDKRRVAGGEAQIGKEVVEHRQDVDVPVVREELFVERRPLTGATGEQAGDIGEGEIIRVPLMREQVTVTKRPVVTGEVIVGKRQVTETQHVSETTREERLTVDDPTKQLEER
ncbi:MAG: putative stress response protein [Candidatus Eremiobacteraeota bacterium]|nr:putative stress response protein [Candidatus Eremiobacteraeota bacterium]